jgi:peptidoglycan-N-acetylglucosamine deacetylase
LLDKYQAPATFFLLGKYVRAYPALAEEIAARSHVIGNHSYDHASLVFFSRSRIIDDLKRCDDAIFHATGKRTTVVRPPFGFRGPQFRSAARAAGLAKIIMWSINGRDWKPQPSSHVSRRLAGAQPGDIILLHDGDHRTSNADRSHTLAALEFWLPRWKDAGLAFAPVT